jgi:exoribonuclease-2
MPEHILFDDAGGFKAATVLTDQTTAVHAELPGGKRVKVKASHIVLRFDTPPPADLLAQAQASAQAMDVDFLWEACPGEEFDFADFAADYVGHPPNALEACALLLALHTHPVYFHRKGRGRFRRAPPEILQAALAGQEKKRQQALAIDSQRDQWLAGQLPAQAADLVPELLYRPDRNTVETKALEAAMVASGRSALDLLIACGAVRDSHDYHWGRFVFHHFPEGTDLDPALYPLNPLESDLPLACVEAFSIDDAQTTEIDDAFSLTVHDGGAYTVGIHIAAPALGFGPDDALGQLARHRLSTVYMPGRKITMLPEAVIGHYTLAAGLTVPALSLYVHTDDQWTITGTDTRMERVPIAANLRHHDLEPLFNAQTLEQGLGDFPYARPLHLLYQGALQRAQARGAAEQTNRQEYSFEVDWTQTSAQGPGRVRIMARPRGSPLDLLVAEWMITANAYWAGLLRDAQIAALYRGQQDGKARMTTGAIRHEGLGVDCYAWMSSPLRRYCDLLNQWQLIAHLRGQTPPFGFDEARGGGRLSAQLLSALRDFELTYAAYAQFQRDMERYWCLRWLLQEQAVELTATVLKDTLVRLDACPLVLGVTGMPTLPRATKVRVALDTVDLWAASAQARFVCVLDSPADPTPPG